MRCRNALAQNDLVVQKAMLFTFRERGEAGERMHARPLDHAHEIVRVRIVPRKKREIGALRVADGISREGSIRDEPAFVNTRRLVGRVAQILISRLHVERVFDVSLSARFVVEFRLDAHTLPFFLCKDIDLMRCAASGECDSRTRIPSVCAQDLRKELLEWKTGRAEREERTLDRIARSYGLLFLPPQHLVGVPIYLFRRHAWAQFSRNV